MGCGKYARVIVFRLCLSGVCKQWLQQLPGLFFWFFQTMVMVSWDSKLGFGGPARWKTPSPHAAMHWAIADWLCLFKCLHEFLEKELCPGRPCAKLDIPCLCCFAFTRNQHALTFLVKMGKVAVFGLWRGGSHAERLPRLGHVLGDLELSSPVHHSLHSGNAALSNYNFQK